MKKLVQMLRHRDGAAAVEMALVAPLLIALAFGSFELGNLFLDQHTLTKQVRDGARYGARLAISSAYSCPDSVFADANWSDEIVHVTEDGVVTGAGTPRWIGYWSRNCDNEATTLVATIRCVPKTDVDTEGTGNTGIYTSLPGTDIPVLTVSGAVKYRSLFGLLGFDSLNICLRAQSEAAVQGL